MSDEIISKVLAYGDRHGLLLPGRHILVACSGGADSLALLDILLQLRTLRQLTITAAHFEHGIRGQDSRDDAAFVRQFCRNQGIACLVKSGDVPAFAAREGLSLELAARTLRYRFLWQAREEAGADVLATAHHADDQAETVLMRILRGTGPDGLAAMRPATGCHIRPLLGVTRQEIERYCQERDLVPRHDATNDLPDCTRNRLRLKVLPYLRTHGNPEISRALCQLSELASEENDYLEQELSAAWPYLQADNSEHALLLEPLQRLHPALRRRALRRFFRENTGSMKDLGFLHIQALSHLVSCGQTGKQLALPGGWQASVAYGRLGLRLQAEAPAGKSLSKVIAAAVPGRTCLCSWILHASLLTKCPASTTPAGFYLDAGVLEDGPLVLRTRRPGDIMSLPAGHKKLKDILIDDKVPREARDGLLLLASGHEVLWVIGRRRSSRYPVTEDTRKILYFRLERKEDKKS